MHEFKLAVPGNPIPKARPRVVVRKGRKPWAITPKRTKEYETLVRAAAALHWAGQEPLDGRLYVRLYFYRGDQRRVDADNCAQAVLDALQTVVFYDDWQIETLYIVKKVDVKNPRVEILVRRAL